MTPDEMERSIAREVRRRMQAEFNGLVKNSPELRRTLLAVVREALEDFVPKPATPDQRKKVIEFVDGSFMGRARAIMVNTPNITVLADASSGKIHVRARMDAGVVGAFMRPRDKVAKVIQIHRKKP